MRLRRSRAGGSFRIAGLGILGGLLFIYFLLLFFFARFGVFCAGVLGAGVDKMSSFRKRMNSSSLNRKRRAVTGRAVFGAGERRGVGGGVSNAVVLVPRLLGRRGAPGTTGTMG